MQLQTFRQMLSLAVAVEVGLLLSSPHGLNHALPPVPTATQAARSQANAIEACAAVASPAGGGTVLPGCNSGAFNLRHPGPVGWVGAAIAGCPGWIQPLATATAAVAGGLALTPQRAPGLCLALAVLWTALWTVDATLYNNHYYLYSVLLCLCTTIEATRADTQHAAAAASNLPRREELGQLSQCPGDRKLGRCNANHVTGSGRSRGPSCWCWSWGRSKAPLSNQESARGH